ncbi:MAG: hypothetical protein J6X44_10560, partial [Thermoguttaceae bacterium]|nr:hypothetical protein [Thermoguttaceae bacterium]
LLDQVVHMDKMDDLDTLPGYSAENDYAPRPQEGLESSPYSRPSRSSDGTSSSKKAPARSSNSRNQDEDVSAPRLNDDVLIIDDDFTSNDAPRRAQAERVAMRETETKRAPAKTRASQTSEKTSNEKTKTSSTSSEKQTTKSEKTSARKKESDELSDARSSTLETAERYDVADSTIRGQTRVRGIVTPVSRMKEDNRFKLFRWVRVN